MNFKASTLKPFTARLRIYMHPIMSEIIYGRVSVSYPSRGKQRNIIGAIIFL